jgi:isoleucyl-tRNA synthetase
VLDKWAEDTELCEILQVSSVKLTESPTWQLKISTTDKPLCPRCRRFALASTDGAVCKRCDLVLKTK